MLAARSPSNPKNPTRTTLADPQGLERLYSRNLEMSNQSHSKKYRELSLLPNPSQILNPKTLNSKPLLNPEPETQSPKPLHPKNEINKSACSRCSRAFPRSSEIPSLRYIPGLGLREVYTLDHTKDPTLI